MVDVEVKLFGPVRDIVGTDTVQLEVHGSHTGEDAFDALAVRYPGLRPWRSSVRLAVNLEYLPFSHTLRAGDEVSFIPPVSGG